MNATSMGGQPKIGSEPAATSPVPKAGAAAAPANDSSQPLFPPQRAFVVQLSREADTAHGQYAGRVEHVVSGHSARFTDSKELLELIAAQLDKVAGAADAPSPAPQGDQHGEDGERE